MNNNIYDIIKLLHVYNPESFIQKEDNINITDVLLIENKQTFFKNSLLYMFDHLLINTLSEISLPVNVIYISEKPIPSDILENRLINLIILNTSIDKDIIYRKIDKILSGKRRLTEGIDRMVEALLSGKGLQYIINESSSIFNNPIYICDNSYKIISYSEHIPVREEVKNATWKNTCKSWYDIDEIIREVRRSGKIKDVYSKDTPVFAKFKFLPKNSMAQRVVVNGNPVAHIVIEENKNQFDSSDSELLSYLCRIVATEMSKDLRYSNSKGLIYENFIQDLLDENIKDETIQLRMKLINLQFSKYLHLLKIIFISENDNFALPYVRNLLESLIGNSKSIIYKNSVLLLISNNNGNPLREEEIKELSNFLEKNNMIAGISRSFTNISSLKKHFIQCEKSIEIGRRLNYDKYLYSYSDYALYHLFEDAESKGDINNICHPAILELIEYDSKNSTDYCKTLYTYFSTNNNLQKSAKHLFIHRNTMEKRIKRIEEILNINFEESDNLLMLFMSLKMIHYVSGEKNLNEVSLKNFVF